MVNNITHIRFVTIISSLFSGLEISEAKTDRSLVLSPNKVMNSLSLTFYPLSPYIDTLSAGASSMCFWQHCFFISASISLPGVVSLMEIPHFYLDDWWGHPPECKSNWHDLSMVRLNSRPHGLGWLTVICPKVFTWRSHLPTLPLPPYHHDHINRLTSNQIRHPPPPPLAVLIKRRAHN